jgi:hypothetical protein
MSTLASDALVNPEVKFRLSIEVKRAREFPIVH